jgi:hypothetical protein
MKVNGIKLAGPRIVERYLPVSDGEAVCFKFRSLRSDEDFEKVMPKPRPPQVMKPGGLTHFNTEDSRFKTALNDWVNHKLNWEFLTSISATDGIEWDKVDMSKSETWALWRKDLEEHFPNSQIDQIFGGFLEAQYISEEGMEKARARFLTGTRERHEMSPSQVDAQVNTQSGVPANV